VKPTDRRRKQEPVRETGVAGHLDDAMRACEKAESALQIDATRVALAATVRAIKALAAAVLTYERRRSVNGDEGEA